MGGNVTGFNRDLMLTPAREYATPLALNPRHRPPWPHRSACDPSHKLAILRHNAENTIHGVWRS